MHLITAAELTFSAFCELIDDYAVSGTPFLGMTKPDIFPYFVRTCIKHSAGIGLEKGVSPYTRYFMVDESGTVYAQGDVRHEATKFNVLVAGQLGYGVPPSKRKCGYGTKMCALLIEKAHEMGFERIIITCRDENTASAKIIESNGGKLLETVFLKKEKINMRRYEVDIFSSTK